MVRFKCMNSCVSSLWFLEPRSLRCESWNTSTCSICSYCDEFTVFCAHHNYDGIRKDELNPCFAQQNNPYKYTILLTPDLPTTDTSWTTKTNERSRTNILFSKQDCTTACLCVYRGIYKRDDAVHNYLIG
jgi:hypothetical protein